VSFKFSLTPVLKYRQACEDDELRSLQELQAREVSLCREAEKLEAELRLSSDNVRRAAFGGMSALDLRCAHERIDLLRLTIAEYRKQIEETIAQQQSQIAKYQLARSNREVISELRDRAFSEYTVRQDRREQRAIDDRFGARAGHLHAAMDLRSKKS
jgi:flagellar export protein FliJ